MKRIRLAAAMLLFVGLVLFTGCENAKVPGKSPELPQVKDREQSERYLYTLVGDMLRKYTERGKPIGAEQLGLLDRAVQDRTSDTIYYTDDEGVLYSYQWGGAPKELAKTDDGTFFVANGAFYYLRKGAVVRQSLSGEEEKVLLEKVAQLFGVSGSSLYFARKAGTEIFEYNVRSQSERILSTDAKFHSLEKNRLVCTARSKNGVELRIVDLSSEAVQTLSLPGDSFVLSGEEVYYLDPKKGDVLFCRNWVSGQDRVICERPFAHLTVIDGGLYACDRDYQNYLRYDLKTGQMSETLDGLRGALVLPLTETEGAATAAKK